MLSLFPQILWLAPFSALALRLAMTVFLAFAAWRHLSQPRMITRAISAIEMLLAAAFFAGAWTQAAGLVSAVLCIAFLLAPSLRTAPRSTISFALIVSLSLLVTGAGALAFDLPL